MTEDPQRGPGSKRYAGPGVRTALTTTLATILAAGGFFAVRGGSESGLKSAEQERNARIHEDSLANLITTNLKKGIAPSESIIDHIRSAIGRSWSSLNHDGKVYEPDPIGIYTYKDVFFDTLEAIKRTLNKQSQAERKKVLDELSQWEEDLSPPHWDTRNSQKLAELIAGHIGKIDKPEWIKKESARIEVDGSYRSMARRFVGDAVHVAFTEMKQEKSRG